MKDVRDLIRVPDTATTSKQRNWTESEAVSLGYAFLASLAIKARNARELSYAPYSNYRVGAALLCISGAIYKGANTETHIYSKTIHAEHNAIAAAIMGGEVNRSERRFARALAISHPGDSALCAECRQVMFEHCDNALIVVANTDGLITGITSLDELTPWAFKPSDLEKKS